MAAVLMMVGLGFAANDAAAQSQTIPVTVTVPEVLMVDNVTALTMSTFDWSTDTGVSTGSVTLTSKANVTHHVQVSSTLTGVTFEVKGPLTAFADASTTQTVASSLAAGSHDTLIDFQALAPVTSVAPGSYTGDITYTVVSGI